MFAAHNVFENDNGVIDDEAGGEHAQPAHADLVVPPLSYDPSEPGEALKPQFCLEQIRDDPQYGSLSEEQRAFVEGRLTENDPKKLEFGQMKAGDTSVVTEKLTLVHAVESKAAPVDGVVHHHAVEAEDPAPRRGRTLHRCRCGECRRHRGGNRRG